MRTMIVDDEKLALDMLEKRVKSQADLTLVYSTTSGDEVIDKVIELNIDLLLLDINIGNILGIELAEEINRIKPEVNIVFVTAYSEYAVSAFEVNAIDYLLKPVTKIRFRKMIEKVSKVSKKKNSNQTPLRFNVFSEGRIYNNENDTLELRTRKASELLFALWHYRPDGLTKEQLIEYLWANQNKESSTMMLHTTIYQIRQVFKKNSLKNPIQYKQGRYLLIYPVESSLEKLTNLLSQPITLENIEVILSIYKDKYFSLSDFYWADDYSQELHQRVLDYLIKGIEDRIVDASTLAKILYRYKEDLLLEEKNVSLIFKYYKENSQEIRAQEFLKEVETYWREELDIPHSDIMEQLTI